MSWTTPDNGGTSIIEYKYRKKEDSENWGLWTVIDSSANATGFTVTDLTNGTTYHFEVLARNQVGEGDPSATATGKPVGPPVAPTALQATPKNTKVTLTWTLSANDGGYPIIRHEYQQKKTTESWPNPSNWTPIDDSGANETYATEHTIEENLTNGIPYDFQVRAVNSGGGTELESPEVTVTDVIPRAAIGKPTPPLNLRATPGDRTITLNWEASANNGGSAIIEHQYQQSDDGVIFSDWEDIIDSAAANGGNKTSYTITSLTNGTPYSFKVLAVNVKDGVELYSDAASVNNTTPASKPDPPENLQATPSDASVELTWEAPSNNGGSPITKYAYRKKYGGRDWETSWTDIPDSAPPSGVNRVSFRVSPLFNSTSYAFELIAVNEGGPNDTELESSGIVVDNIKPVGPPTSPRTLTGTYGDAQVILSWEIPRNDGGSSIIRYNYQKKETADDWSDVWHIIPNSELVSEDNTRTYTVETDLTNGTSYNFKVRAVSQGLNNNEIDGDSAETGSITPIGPPTAPTSLSATNGYLKTILSWTPSDSDGGSAITEHKYRQQIQGEPWEDNWVSIPISAPNQDHAISYTITGLSGGIVYKFELLAVNSGGPNDSQLEGPSDSVTDVSPTGKPDPPTSFQAVAGDAKVILSWVAPSNNGGSTITKYHYKKKGTGNWPRDWIGILESGVDEDNDDRYEVTGLTNGTTYSFRLRAINFGGEDGDRLESSYVAADNITPQSLAGSPDAPTNLQASPDYNYITLTWDDPSDDGGSPIVRIQYAMQEGNGSFAQWTNIPDSGVDEANDDSYKITGLTPGTTYSFKIQAQNRPNNTYFTSPETSAVSATTTPTPTLFREKISSGENHTCALENPNQQGGSNVLCWGSREEGRLGNGESAGAGESFNFSNPVLEVGSGSGLLNDITQVSAGKSHTCALTNNEKVVCWGSGGSGQLGNDTLSISEQPQYVVGTNGSGTLGYVQQISTGDDHTCALLNNGSVFCWGDGGSGRLGGGDYSDYQTPKQVKDVGGTAFLTGIAQISAGGEHTCALRKNGRVVCWGDGFVGQLGNGSKPVRQKTPVKVLEPAGTSGELKNISQISLGGEHTCALKNDGRVLCWGKGADGQLGVGSTGSPSRPVMVVATDQSSGGTPLTNITQLSAGDKHTCALDSSNQVYCWGKGASKRLGQIDDINNNKTPQRVKTDVTNVYLSAVEQVGIGHEHSCALKIDGSLVCWGERSSGQSGDGKLDVIEGRGIPAPVVSEPDPPLTNIISAGGLHSCQVNLGDTNNRPNGSIQCWGRGFGGQLGNNVKFLSNRGQNVLESDSSGTGYLLDMIQISSGENHSCALNSSGQVYCWGFGILGDGEDLRISPRPVLVDTIVGGNPLPSIKQISVGNKHTCAVTTTGGKVLCWGNGGQGRLGNGGASAELRPDYVRKEGDSTKLSNIVQVSAGHDHTCATENSGFVFCWGSNYNKKSGGNTSDQFTKAFRISSSKITATQVSAGRRHTCAIRPNSKVACWGNGANGLLGRGPDFADDGYPQDVSNLENVVQISTRNYHTCAVTTDSKVLCWGDNEYGQTGRPVSNPTILTAQNVRGNGGNGNLTDIKELSVGKYHTCARKSDWTSVCWGRGGDGQLGATNYANSDSPVDVSITSGTPKKLILKQRVSAGYKHTCAVKSSDQGKIYCWGNAERGRLGTNADSGDKKRGLLVKGVGGTGNLKNIAQVTGGADHTCALDNDGKVFCWGYGNDGRLGQGLLK